MQPRPGETTEPRSIQEPERAVARTRGRRLFLVGALAVTVVSLAGAGTWLIMRGADGSGPAQGEPSPEITLSVTERKALESGLSSQNPRRVAAVAAAGVAEAFGGAKNLLLPKGSTLRIDPESFEAISEVAAGATATIEGPTAGAVRLLLVREGGSWRVLSMEVVR